MWMDQVYQIRAIMEATGAVKDAPVIRELLDEALGVRRRKAAGNHRLRRAARPGNYRNAAYSAYSIAQADPA
jgi:hypothetical protein